MGTYYSNALAHYGIGGQRWGVRRYQNKDGTLTEEGKKRYSRNDTVFVSGSSKTEDAESGYYRKNLPEPIKKELEEMIKSKSKIIVGDAPGIDRQVQNYLNDKHYDRVEIYGPGTKVRYSANKKWKTHPIDAPEFEPGSKEWLAKKDMAMEKAANKGLAVILDEGSKATRKNIERLLNHNKTTMVYQLDKKGQAEDRWINANISTSDYLLHYGIKGQRWGVRKYQNEDGSYTPEGKEHYHEMRLIATRTKRAAMTKADVDSIFNSLSAKDRALLDADPNDKEWMPFEAGQFVAKRFLKKFGDESVAFLDVMQDNGGYTIALATKSGDKYRGKGYASELGQQAVKWLNANPAVMNQKVTWRADKENAASNRLAKKLGFVKDEEVSDDKWNIYSLKRN